MSIEDKIKLQNVVYTYNLIDHWIPSAGVKFSVTRLFTEANLALTNRTASFYRNEWQHLETRTKVEDM